MKAWLILVGFVLCLLIIGPAQAQPSRQVDGYSDNARNGFQADRNEAILDAKRKAIEFLGVRISERVRLDMGLLKEWITEHEAKGTIVIDHIIDKGYLSDRKTFIVTLIFRPGTKPPGEKPGKPSPRVAVGQGAPKQIGAGLDTMVLVPAGWFIMGSDSGYDDEKPRRRVYLDGFFIDKYPVTNVRFQRFGRPEKDYGSKFNGDRQPVVGVTWFQVREYCASAGKRLPTEAEWEKAARGVDGRKYPWGNAWPGLKVIWDKNSGKRTHPVDRDYNTHRSPYGAVDMSGNVWEWVQDRHRVDYYGSAPDRNPKGPPSGRGRVLRGGSWYTGGTKAFRAANRIWYAPDFRTSSVSFRCAKASK